MDTYIVQPGDTLSAIARRNGLTWQELQSLNDLANPNLIRPGDEIRVPSGSEGGGGTLEGVRGPGGLYTVRRGETLTKIAEDNDTTVQAIVDANDIANRNRIREGQVLQIPGRPERTATYLSAPPPRAPRPAVPLPRPRPEPPADGRFNIPAQMAENARAEPGAGGPPVPMAHPGRPATQGPIDYGNWEPIQPENEQVRLAQQANDPMMFSTYRQIPQGRFNIPPQMAANARAEPQRSTPNVNYGSLSKPELDNIFGRMNLAQLNQVSVDRLTSPLALRTFSEHLERARRLEASLASNYQQGWERGQQNFETTGGTYYPASGSGGVPQRSYLTGGAGVPLRTAPMGGGQVRGAPGVAPTPLTVPTGPYRFAR